MNLYNEIEPYAAARQAREDAELIAWAWETGLVTPVYETSPLHGSRVGWGCFFGGSSIQWGNDRVLTAPARAALKAAMEARP